MINPNTSSVKNRRKKRTMIKAAYAELQWATPVYRICCMNEEFGPFWYYYLELDQKIPDELKVSSRYKNWVNTRHLV